jgi:DNA primase
MDTRTKLRYINPPTDKESIIFGYNFIEEYTEKPLFVTEGVFDAIPIKGVALLGSVLNECKIQALNSTRRNKVFVVDKDANGYKLGYTAIKHGWSISFVDGDVTDVNDAVQKYGKLWTLQNLMTNIKSGFEARVYLETLKHSA